MTTPLTTLGWPAGTVPADYVLGGVRAVLPGAIIDNARVVVRDGLIAEVSAVPAGSGAAGSAADLDGAGLLCVPGLIDVHSDALEKERAPRPGVHLPWDFGVTSLEGKMSAAGITTAFQDKLSGAMARTVRTAIEVCAAVTGRSLEPAPLVGHRILYRLDARSPEGASALAEALEAHPSCAQSLPLVSHEDHTPGQGQYADRRYMERYVAGSRGLSEAEAERHVDEMIAERDANLPALERNMAWVGAVAARGGGPGGGRGRGARRGSPGAGDALRARGGSVAEFPTTAEAAGTARALGLPIVMGAPNV